MNRLYPKRYSKDAPLYSVRPMLLFGLVLLLATTSAAGSVVPAAVTAQADERCFAETSMCISGPVREFWEQNDGLALLGLPITPLQQEQVEGTLRSVQWFERNRVELHPEQAYPYHVLLGRIGIEQLEQQGRDWRTFSTSEPQPGCRFFAETGHNVCGEMLTTWQNNSTEAKSLALFGLPVSGAVVERLHDGREYTVQWFERARLELHPQNQPPYHVQMGLLGSEQVAAAAAGSALTNTTPANSVHTPAPLQQPAAAVQTMQQAPASIATLVAEDTALYITMPPIFSDAPHAASIQAAYPKLFIDSAPAGINQILVEDFGVTFQDDIQPWIGDEVAIVVQNVVGASGVSALRHTLSLQTDAPLSLRSMMRQVDDMTSSGGRALIVTARDPAGAQAFLDTQRIHRTEQGEEFIANVYQGVTIYEDTNTFPGDDSLRAFALFNSYVIFASDTNTVMAMINRQLTGGASLATNPDFTTVQANLPDTTIASLYISGAIYAEMVAESNQSLSGSSLAQPWLENPAIVQGIGVAFSFAESGFVFDSITTFDMSMLDAQTRSEIEAARRPVDSERLQRIRSDALALMTFHIPASFKDQMLAIIAADPDGQQSRQEMEQELNIDLERDLLNWMSGDASLVLMPFWMDDQDAQMMPAPAFYFGMEPMDRAAAEAGINKIADGLEAMPDTDVVFQPEEIGEVPWQVARDQTTIALGHTFIENDLLVALGNQALEAASTGNLFPITSDSDFVTVLNNLPDPNSGITYLDVEALVGAMLSEQTGAGMDIETQEMVVPVKAMGMAATPGIDANGITHERLFLLIR